MDASPCAVPGWSIYGVHGGSSSSSSMPPLRREGVVPLRMTLREAEARKVFMSFFEERGLFSHLIESFDEMVHVALPHMMAEFGLIIIASERTQTMHLFSILPPTEIRKPQKREKLGYVTDLSVREARDRGLTYEGAVITDVVHEVWRPRPGAEPIILPRKDGSRPSRPSAPDHAPPAISTLRALPGVGPNLTATGGVPPWWKPQHGSPDPGEAGVPEITTQLLMSMAGLTEAECFVGTSPALDALMSPTAQWIMDERSTGLLGSPLAAGAASSSASPTCGCRPDPARFELVSRTISRDAKLFTLPIMVGSSRCHSRDAPPAPSEPWNKTEGYCVVNGMEKMFMPPLNPVANMIFVLRPTVKGEAYLTKAELRSRHGAKVRSTATMNVVMQSSYRGTGMVTARVKVPFIEVAIPLFAMMRMIGFRSVEHAAAVICARGGMVPRSSDGAEASPTADTEEGRFELWLRSMLRNRSKTEPDFEAMETHDIVLWVGATCLKKRTSSTLAAAMTANEGPSGLAADGPEADSAAAAGASAAPPPHVVMKSIQHFLSNEFLPHVGLEMSELTLANKRALLAFMVWRLSKVVRHELPPDERDHLGHQMIEPPGRLLVLLLRQLYSGALKKRTVRTLKLNADTGRHFSPAEAIPSRRLSQDLGYAMSTGSWGVHKGGSAQGRKGIMQMLNRLNPQATISNLRSARKPGELKDMTPRLLGVHEWGVACPSETTEGENCGLLKHLAAHAYVCHGRPTRMLAELVLAIVSSAAAAGAGAAHGPVPSPAAPAVLLVNGMLLRTLLPDGEAAAAALRAARRARVLPMDVEVAYSAARGELQVNAENGTFRRPLLVADRGDPRATAERMAEVAALARELSGAELFRALLRRGHVELIGKNEEQELVVRASPYPFPRIETKGEEARRELDELAATMGCGDLRLSEVEEDLRARLRALGVAADDLDDAVHAERRARIQAALAGGAAAVPMGVPLPVLLLQPYTHYEIHPAAIHSITTSLIPFSDHNQAPRNTYQCAMGKAAIGEPQESDESRAYVRYPGAQVPLVMTAQEAALNPRYSRSGANVVVAIMCFQGDNEEDSLNLCRADLQLGLFRTEERMLYSDTASVTSRSDPQKFERPGDEVWGKRDCDYSALGEDGYAEPGTVVRGGSAIIGKTVTVQNGVKRCQSTLVGDSEPPTTVVSVVEAEARDRRRLKVQVSRPVVPIIGDKFSARHGQKGVMGDKLAREDMPWGVLPVQVRGPDGSVVGMRFTEVRPNILMNPNAIPSRMTVGQLLEMVAGTAAAAGGYVADGTGFGADGTDGAPLRADQLRDELRRLGLNPSGTMRLRSGITGEELTNVEVFMGVCYWQRLRQQAEKKIRAVNHGRTSALTRQPMEGKAGGLRAGEMERDAFIAHGAPEVVTNTYLTRSDDYVAYACTQCGMLACPPRAPDPRLRHLGGGQQADGYCTACRTSEHVARFRTPYALKLMIQELASLGVVIRPDIHASDEVDFANAPAPGVPAARESLPTFGRPASEWGSANLRSGASRSCYAEPVDRRGGPSAHSEGVQQAPPTRDDDQLRRGLQGGAPQGGAPQGGAPQGGNAARVASLPGGARIRGPDVVDTRDVAEMVCETEWEGGAYG
jgi:DNA-directed RNA polymerase II subunit RPB2